MTKRTLKLLLTCSIAALGTACGTQMKPGTDMVQIEADMMGAPPMTVLTGTWESQGSDVAPLLAADPFNIVKITAIFKADDSYEVTAIDKKNSKTVFTGTYRTTPGKDDLRNIDLQQNQPAAAVSKGIYRIDGTVTPQRMTYEVVQVQPDIKATPPTVEKGFGSTNDGKLGMANVQKYVRLAQ
jgi:hypothetical protein